MKYGRFLLPIVSAAIALPAAALDFSNSWFQPKLEINESQVCESLEQYTKAVLRGESDIEYPIDFSNVGLPHYLMNFQVNGKNIGIRSSVEPGCGGACEGYNILASASPSRGEDSYNSVFEKSQPFRTINFLKSQSMYFVLNKTNEYNVLYKLEEDATWNKVCTVRKTPTKEEFQKIEGDVESLQASLGVLRRQVGSMRQGAGSRCGQMGTHWRWGDKITDEFGLLLHAPKIKPKTEKHQDDSTYDIDLENLKLWSLLGVGEFESFNEYEKTLVTVVALLSEFYQNNFHWSKINADSIADYALKYAISSGIRFYAYKPFRTQQEITLRKSILENRPIADIKKIDISGIERSSKPGFAAETVLNIAVKHPEAIEYLLESGFDANQKNEFGKTPLMYAAQYNGVDAAKKLIEHGAEVNTGTFIPHDGCFYALHTSNMSPLHYAVRYADRTMIDLLLDSGASKFHNVDNRQAELNRIEYPIDWLSRFENPLLSERDKQHVGNRLQLPPDEEKASIAKKLNIQGEKFYSEKNYRKAADKFSEATQVDVSNIRALANHGLALLKLGEIEPSLEVSRKVINSKSASDKEKASAYFNSALACDSAGADSHVHYNGYSYCYDGPIGDYISAYKIYPTKTRANVIVERLMSKNYHKERLCIVGSENIEAFYKKTSTELLFLHKKPMKKVIGNFTTFARHPNSIRVVTLDKKDTIDLQNGYYLSTYKSNDKMHDNFTIKEGICTSTSSEIMSELEYYAL